jgi:hypothetical protein
MSYANFILDTFVTLNSSSYNSVFVPFNSVYTPSSSISGIKFNDSFFNGLQINESGVYFFIYSVLVNNNYNGISLQYTTLIGLTNHSNYTEGQTGSNFYMATAMSGTGSDNFSVQMTGQFLAFYDAGTVLALQTINSGDVSLAPADIGYNLVNASLYVFKINSSPYMTITNNSTDNGSSLTSSIWCSPGGNPFYNSTFPQSSSFESNPDFTFSSYWAPNGTDLFTINNTGVYLYIYTVSYYNQNNTLISPIVTAQTSKCTSGSCGSEFNYPGTVYYTGSIPFLHYFGIIKNFGTLLTNSIFSSGITSDVDQNVYYENCLQNSNANNGCDYPTTNQLKEDFTIYNNTYYQIFAQGLMTANAGDIIYPSNLGAFVDSNNNVGTYLSNVYNSNNTWSSNNATLSLLKIPNGSFYCQVISTGALMGNPGENYLLPLQQFAISDTGQELNNGFTLHNGFISANNTTGGNFLIMFSVTIVQQTSVNPSYDSAYVSLVISDVSTSFTLNFSNQFAYYQNNTFTVNGQYIFYLNPGAGIGLYDISVTKFTTASTPCSSATQIGGFTSSTPPVAISVTLIQIDNM